VDQIRKLFILANVCAFFVLVYLVIGLWPRWFPPKPKPKPVEWTTQMDWVDKRKGVQILAFYASPNVIEAGQHISLCYGVAQAKTIKIEPPAGDAWPTFTRCLDVAPGKTTTYTLTAIDAAGKQIQQTTEVQVLRRR
jgi:hypothetical protein